MIGFTLVALDKLGVIGRNASVGRMRPVINWTQTGRTGRHNKLTGSLTKGNCQSKQPMATVNVNLLLLSSHHCKDHKVCRRGKNSG